MDITPAKRDALIDALLLGPIWPAERGHSSGYRHHHRVTINRLQSTGLIHWQSSTSPFYTGGYVLTDKGRAVARSLDDTESSASRQHYIDTGKYLTYGDREELNPPQFNIGDEIASKINPREHHFVVVDRQFVPDMQSWLYAVEVADGQYKGTRFDQAVLNPKTYGTVQPPKPERDWGLLAPVAAQAATLVALGRGDEVVEDYTDGVITALELLTELVEAGQ